MNLKNYSLTDTQEQRLINSVKAALAIPFIDSLEDFIWEGIFCYTKTLELADHC